MGYEWTKDLATGIVDIDLQHKELFRRINDLFDACARQRGRDEILKYMEFLLEYAAYHFSAEQREMARYAYPRQEAHEAEHERFTREINALNLDMRMSGIRHEIIQVTLWNSAEWLAGHVKGTDRELAAFLRERRHV